MGPRRQKNWKVGLLAALAGSPTAILVAATADPEVIAMSQWSADRLDQPGFFGIALLLALVLALVAVAWVTQMPGAGSTGFMRGRDFAAGNLFLGVSFDKLPVSPAAGSKLSAGSWTAYLRELGLSEALIVSPIRLDKADTIVLHLGSLPDFPSKASDIMGEVKACKSLGGTPENFLVRVRFKTTADFPRYDLLQYLKNLAPKGGSPIHQSF